MKKMYCCFICFFLSIFSFNFCYCQVSFGVKSGMNIATVKNIIAFPKNRLGWYVGGIAKLPIYKKFFLQSELLYSSKGYGVNQMNPLNAPNGVYRLNYLNLPILSGYKIDKKTSMLFGPELGYLIIVREVYPGGDNFNVSKSYPPKFDIDLDLGLDYKITNIIGIEIRYIYGLNTLYNTDAVGNRHVRMNGANRVFQLGINLHLR